METPKHYRMDPEPRKVIEQWALNFNLGNVIKYVSRAGKKEGEDIIDDLIKARNYLDFEISRLSNMSPP